MYFKIDPFYGIIRLLTSTLDIVQPLSSIYFFKLFLDGIFIEKKLQYCLQIILYMAILNLFALVINWLVNNRLTPISVQKITNRMTKTMFHKYLKTDMQILNNPSFYDKYTQVINDIPNRMGNVLDTVCALIGNLLSITTIITLMLQIDGLMIAISLIGVVVNLIMSPIMNKLGYKAYLERTSKEREHNYIKRIFYLFEYAKELKILPFSKIFLKKFDERSNDLILITKKYSYKLIFTGIITGLFNILSFTAILLYLAFIALKGALTFGDVGSLYNASQELKERISQLLSIVPKFDENSRYISNYDSLFEIVCEVETSNLEKPFDEHLEKISLENVSFKYNKENDEYILKNIHMEIKKNEKIAIVGHNGAGKSTLINLLLRLYDADQGSVKYNDSNYTDVNVEMLRNQFIVIMQDCQYYATTLAENVLMKIPESQKEEEIVIQALKTVGLYDKVKALPNGIHSILTKEFNDDGIILSGGETQKLMVARVFASEAPIIILDEVTSNMDAISEHKLFQAIDQFAENKTMIYISHKLSTTKAADTIYVLDQGQIIEKGTHAKLLQSKGKYFDMFKLQAEKYGDAFLSTEEEER
jgi:ATP-binding cassette subfamily B protein